MENLHQQISELREQVVSLSRVVEELPEKIVGTLSSQLPNPESTPSRWKQHNLEHKDVLVDKNHHTWASHVNESEISTEWQVRRLTAQLTTAYNRIAALEEELINRRMTAR